MNFEIISLYWIKLKFKIMKVLKSLSKEEINQASLEALTEQAEGTPWAMLEINGQDGYDIYFIQDHHLHPESNDSINDLETVKLIAFESEEELDEWLKQNS